MTSSGRRFQLSLVAFNLDIRVAGTIGVLVDTKIHVDLAQDEVFQIDQFPVAPKPDDGIGKMRARDSAIADGQTRNRLSSLATQSPAARISTVMNSARNLCH